MRTRASALLAIVTVSVLGVSALTGCQPAEDTRKDWSSAAPSTGGAAPSTPTGRAEPVASTPATTVSTPARPATAKPATIAPSTAGSSPATTAKETVKDKKLTPAARAGALVRITGAGAPTDVPVDPGEIRPGVNTVLVAAFGASASGPRTVLFVGVDGLTALDGKRLEHLIRGMVEYVDATGGSVPTTGMKEYDAGPRGGTLECMPGSTAQPAAICAWADTYTAAVAYFEDVSADQAAVRFKAMRADLEK